MGRATYRGPVGEGWLEVGVWDGIWADDVEGYEGSRYWPVL